MQVTVLQAVVVEHLLSEVQVHVKLINSGKSGGVPTVLLIKIHSLHFLMVINGLGNTQLLILNRMVSISLRGGRFLILLSSQ